MDKTFIRILVIISSSVLFYASIVLVASISQLADAADRVYQGLGQPIFWLLFSIFLFFLISPFYLYFKSPKALIPPDETTGPKHDEYLAQLSQRLASNNRLIGMPLQTRSDIESAMAVLSRDADKVIREIANAVFVSTAISQNGRLDGLVTFVTQARMVWRIAHVFQQRPSPRQMLYLYSNVGANALLSESIDDIDLSDIVAPILSSSIAATIPGTSFIMNSITNGAANAFMTLRVGIITRQYCETLSTPAKGIVRRNATLMAIALIGSIVKENSSRILSGSLNILKSKAKDAVDSTMQGANFVATKVSNSIGTGANSIGNAVSFSAVKASNSVTTGGKSIGKAVSSTVESTKNLAKKLNFQKKS